MNKLATVIAAIALVGTPAFAADMAVKAPPPAPVYSWTGFYVGGHLGGAWGLNSTSSYVQQPFLDLDPVNFGGQSQSAVLGGAQAGYSWQLATSWLVGVEGDISKIKLTNNSFDDNLTAAGVPVVSSNNVTMNETLNWLASARGRIGYVAGPWLLYGTGGAAWANIHYFSRQNYFSGTF